MKRLSAVAALLLTTGCAADVPAAGFDHPAPVPELAPDQRVSIVFESYNFGQAGAWTDTFTELIGRFHRAHPNIRVTAQKPRGTSPNPAADTISSVRLQSVEGAPPDVAQLGFGDLDFTVHGLGAKPLDHLVGREAVQANFDGVRHPYAPSARRLGDLGGHTYGVPFVFSTPVLYYNADLFERAGLDPDAPPTTWDEVRARALAVRQRTGAHGVYVDCLTKLAKDWCFQSLVRSNGGEVLSVDRRALSFADRPAVEAVAMAQDLVRSGAHPKLGQQEGYEAFARGEVGMILETSAMQGTFRTGAADHGWELRAAPMPGFTGRQPVPTNSGAALFILSDDPAEQRAGWALIKFLTSEEAYTLISSQIGYLPLRTGLVTDPAGLADWVARNPLVQPNLDQLAKLEAWVSFPGEDYLRIRDGMMEAVEQVVFEGADPVSTLKLRQEDLNLLMPAGTGR